MQYGLFLIDFLTAGFLLPFFSDEAGDPIGQLESIPIHQIVCFVRRSAVGCSRIARWPAGRVEAHRGSAQF
jgi:hypothetical protein